MSLPLILSLALGVGSLVIVPLLYAEFSGRHRRAELEEAVDGRWNGHVRRGGLFHADRIELRVDDVPGEITFKRGGEIPWSRVWFNLPYDRRLRVTPEVFSHKVRRLFGATELELDHSDFDRRFWVETSDNDWARGFLDEETRHDLVDVHLAEDAKATNDVMLDVGPSGLSLRVAWASLRNRQDMGKFVDLGISLLRKTRGPVKASGVVVKPVQAAGGTECPVCGHPVAEKPHACHACHTRHHPECWTYFGGCAVFACEGQR